MSETRVVAGERKVVAAAALSNRRHESSFEINVKPKFLLI